MRHLRASAIPLLAALALAGCGPEDVRWDGYALRDRPGEDSTRLIGSYGTFDGCRAGLLATDSDASSEALVCARGCPPPVRGMLEQCATVQVVRAVQTVVRDDLATPQAAPAAVEGRSPDSGPSRP
ncbi:hypothetical protein [Sphingomonas nostoxanthinifaciens]|uniref:hypothetical protein n=1 Tax=Sphingomonas nostoxanthinifaciens TaxID=2872652 RepID=UPI001CC1C8AF|nr:hypothetical protein [Sphingomonas nostoxanthinifaciens]UAK23988.1 hypothetical protein K8P63_16770 [Sphingomonas nostoxanthinifaciens]